MLYREVEIFNGDRYRVPQCIQRIDHRATHGWQLRYGGTRLFSDGSKDGSGAEAALALATRELLRRIGTLEAPTTLQSAPSANKASGLPPGISGPIVRGRAGGRARDCSLAVLLPRFGEAARRRSVYIATEGTFTQAKLRAAVKRAVAMRAEAEEAYRKAATRARRAEAKVIRAMLLAGEFRRRAPREAKKAA
ncbi:MAG: hypothetical protein HZC37_09570 [Burkholderiales bacterium]|nr:hypothetical protein [Burkholderiales bacterium]